MGKLFIGIVLFLTSLYANENINVEEEFWNIVKESDTLEDYEYYKEIYPQGKFITIANYKIHKLEIFLGKTWRDCGTSLEWQVSIDKQKYSWEKAVAYCKELILNGKDDWRLASKYELHSILTTEGYTNPKSYSEETYITKPLLRSMDMEYQFFWSSTTHEKNSHQAWYVYFLNGVEHHEDKSLEKYVRCVRGGE